MARTKEEIWAGDLLDRSEEADQLEAFIGSVAAQKSAREDAQAFTISIDASYGEGKTYFLKRLAEQLSINHPVAFVDAWRDDLADEPFTALAATLKEALSEYVDDKSALKEKWVEFVSKAGKVAKIAGWGLTKRLATLAITSSAVEAVGDVIGDVAEDTKDALIDGVTDTASGVVDDTESAIKLVAPGKWMQDRIDDFEAGQQAIDALKNSLVALVAALDENHTHPPIVIFIDELDRCRPTYAVKLLEEVKHLFDVPGLVFVFGIHTDQLAHSVSGAYGSGFDGRAYLSRFMHRQYRLRPPELTNFIRFLLEKYEIDPERLWFPHIKVNDADQHMTTSEIISYFLNRYEISTRDTIRVIETLQTSCALTGKMPLCMPLFLPLILSKERGGKRGELRVADNNDLSLQFKFFNHFNDETEYYTWWDGAKHLLGLTVMTPQQVSARINEQPTDCVAHIYTAFRNDAQNAGKPLARPDNYIELLETVGRFSSAVSVGSPI